MQNQLTPLNKEEHIDSTFERTSAVPIHTHSYTPFWWPIAWPLVLLLAAFPRTAHPKNFTLNTAFPWLLSNTPAKYELDWMNGCWKTQWTDRLFSILVRFCEKYGSIILKRQTKIHGTRSNCVFLAYILPFKVTWSACMFFVLQQFPALVMVVKPES